MSDIKFSVVIPLYNKELSIRNTILSVLNQSYQNFEIVIINDGSTDNSVEAVKTIKDERIRLIHQNNQGVSSARNKGIQEAKYDWIAFLDGDDLWEKNHLEEITKMMNIYPDDKVFVTSFEYSDNRTLFKHKRNNSIYRVENYFKEAVDEILVWTSIVVLHIDCIKKVGLFKEFLSYGEDLELWSRISKNYSFIKSSNVTAMYKVDAENRSSLTKNMEKTYVYYCKYNESRDFFERNYYNKMILLRLYEYFKLGRFYEFNRLRIRLQVNLADIFYFFIKINFNKLRFF